MHLNSQISALLQGLNNPSLPGIDLSLERMHELLKELGNPEQKLPPVIHVAGTNGKGSTIAYLKAIYTAAGYKVHAYTSPHLVRFNERIVVAGDEISDAALLPLLQKIAEAARTIPVTFFEATTAAAFLAFSEHTADVVLLETGLGGRLDATNVVAHPAMTILTPIDYDHMEFLGDELTKIATEKAGILKNGTPCIVGKQHPEALSIIQQKADALNAACYALGKQWDYAEQPESETIRITEKNLAWHIPKPALLGVHQYHNAALAAVAVRQCQAIPVPPEAIAKGITQATWPARLQRLTTGPLVESWDNRGPVILDGGHNLHAAKALAQWLKAQNQPATLLLGMMRRKDPAPFLATLAPHIRSIIPVIIPGEDCHPPEIVAEAARSLGIRCLPSSGQLSDAQTTLAAEEAGILLIAGSLFLAGELLKNHG